MDVWGTLLFLAISLSLCLAFSLILPKRRSQPKLPPGPPSIPFFLDFLRRRRSIFDLEAVLRQLHAAYGPIVSFRLGLHPTIFITDRHLAHRALVQGGGAIDNRPPPFEPKLVFCQERSEIGGAPYGPYWRRLRRNLTSGFLHPSRLALYAPARKWASRVLIERLRAEAATAAGGVVAAGEILGYGVHSLMLFMLFGQALDEKTVLEIKDLHYSVMASFGHFPVFSFFPAITKRLFRKKWEGYMAVWRRQEEIFIPLIRSRQGRVKQQGQPGYVGCYADSLFDVRLPEENDRGLTEYEMVKLCWEFINAGAETTAAAFQWTMANLVGHPEIQAKLFDEIVARAGGDDLREEDLQKMPYLKAVVLEGLRRHPPTHFLLPRTATEELEVGGYVVPRGATVNFLTVDLGMDERVWAAPAEFRPERFLAGGEGEGVDVTGSREIKMLPFGAGRRMCPGYGLAMIHLAYLVGTLVREFEWAAVEGEEVDLSETLHFSTVMKNPLRATITSRTS